jgi:hypothetical protein
LTKDYLSREDNIYAATLSSRTAFTAGAATGLINGAIITYVTFNVISKILDPSSLPLFQNYQDA